jgi:hypothetical protein
MVFIATQWFPRFLLCTHQSPQSESVRSPEVEAGPDELERVRRNGYVAAFRPFAAGLTPAQRKTLNGSARPDWQGSRTFALPVVPDNPAYKTDVEDVIFSTLDELAVIRGAMPKIAVWLNDRMRGLDVVLGLERFRLAVARICEAKNPRREAEMVSLALGMNLRGNSNGFDIAQHFGLSPQALHEILGDTCKSLGLPKPLAKVKKDRYRKTQYSHKLTRKPITP